MIVGSRDEFIEALEDLGGRNDIQHGSADDAIGMIEAEAMRDAPTTVVAGDAKAIEAECGHYGDLIGGHRALQ